MYFLSYFIQFERIVTSTSFPCVRPSQFPGELTFKQHAQRAPR